MDIATFEYGSVERLCGELYNVRLSIQEPDDKDIVLDLGWQAAEGLAKIAATPSGVFAGIAESGMFIAQWGYNKKYQDYALRFFTDLHAVTSESQGGNTDRSAISSNSGLWASDAMAMAAAMNTILTMRSDEDIAQRACKKYVDLPLFAATADRCGRCDELGATVFAAFPDGGVGIALHCGCWAEAEAEGSLPDRTVVINYETALADRV